jgi:hypothetical protein
MIRLAILSLILVTGTVSCQSQQPSQEQVVQRVQDFFNKATPGTTYTFVAATRRQLGSIQTYLWRVAFRRGDDSYQVLVEEPDLRVVSLSSSRQDKRRRGLGRTGGTIFSGSAAAQNHLVQMASRLAGGIPTRVVKFEYKPDVRDANNRWVAGRAYATVSPLVNGHTFVAGKYRISMEVDPQDGALLTYGNYAPIPPVDPAPNSTISRDAAVYAALGTNPGRYRAALGYAKKKNGTRARVCWMVSGLNQRVLVDAGTGSVIERTATK